MTFRDRCSRRAFMMAGSVLSGAVALGLRLPAFATQATPVALEKKGAYTILVAGLDTRTPEEPENTDVIMISRVDLYAETVRTISIPRDLHLEVPTFGFTKINGAYNIASKQHNHDWNAGIALFTQTMEQNFGLKIDGAITTNFDGYAGVVDALGGVTVVNPYDVHEDKYPTRDYGFKEIYYPAGELTLNGEQALEFSRTRHMDGDEGRVMRQHIVLTALLNQAQEPQNIWNLPEIAEASRQFVTTNFPKPVQDQLVSAVPYIFAGNIAWGTITDYLWGETLPDGGWMYQADWTQLPEHVRGWLGVEAIGG